LVKEVPAIALNPVPEKMAIHPDLLPILSPGRLEAAVEEPRLVGI
jgi:hypothetical protein